MRTISPSRASALLAISVDAIWTAIRGGHLESIVTGRRAKIATDALEAFRATREYAWLRYQQAKA